jgi:hypothetical protein
MQNKNVDGVIEAIRYKDGHIEFVRAYERRGMTFSDRVLLDRRTLLERLRQGKRFVLGRRKESLASTFEIARPVMLVRRNGNEYIATRPDAERDEIEGALYI